MSPDPAQHRSRSPALFIYERLYAAYGPQGWWPSESAFETIVGAILTQHTAWTNVERAIQRLRGANVLSPVAMATLEEGALAELIRPSGCFRVKASRLKAFCTMLSERFDGRLEVLLALPAVALREQLLNTHGIGPETADAIVLYAAGRPSFVVDAYTCRLFSRLGLAPHDLSYEGWRQFFMSNLPCDAALFSEYHALIVRQAKQSCAKQPRCSGCILQTFCPAGAELLGAPVDGVGHFADAAGDTVR